MVVIQIALHLHEYLLAKPCQCGLSDRYNVYWRLHPNLPLACLLLKEPGLALSTFFASKRARLSSWVSLEAIKSHRKFCMLALK